MLPQKFERLKNLVLGGEHNFIRGPIPNLDMTVEDGNRSNSGRAPGESAAGVYGKLEHVSVGKVLKYHDSRRAVIAVIPTLTLGIIGGYVIISWPCFSSKCPPGSPPSLRSMKFTSFSSPRQINYFNLSLF